MIQPLRDQPVPLNLSAKSCPMATFKVSPFSIISVTGTRNDTVVYSEDTVLPIPPLGRTTLTIFLTVLAFRCGGAR